MAFIQLVPFNYSTIIASIIEPVTGEGGIKEIDLSVADKLSELDIPLISDEIQCGLAGPVLSRHMTRHHTIYLAKHWRRL
jgi:acetylornithine/succinyldiaminopimelate/putrescine aminotransferase